jgi:LysM repeat protein
MLSPLKRPTGASSLWTAAAVAVGTGLLLTVTSCGDNGGTAQSASTVTIQPTSYVTRKPVTESTAPATPNTADAEGRSQVEQSYVVEAGDYPVLIATMFDVDLDDLAAYNKWNSDYSDFPSVGETVRIPPGAKFIDPDATETTDEGTEDTRSGSETESTTSTTVGGPCDPGSYTLEAGDYPNGVAAKFDVSLEDLNAANAATPGYDQFGVGLEIVIPPPSDCE